MSTPAPQDMPLLCPSTSAANATLVIGVVQRDETDGRAQVAYAAGPAAFDDELRALTGPVDPAEVLRLAGPCAESGCAHYVDDCCSLGERVAAELPLVVQRAPRCSIRSRCRWYAEQGIAACRRCPGIVTSSRDGDERLLAAATPPMLSAG